MGSTSSVDNEYIFNIYDSKKPVILDMESLHPNFCDNFKRITINYPYDNRTIQDSGISDKEMCLLLEK